ncbi:MAG: 4'-phosphopantetheinyl transferase superfamily protein [Eubacteriales bacterium]|jgi:phosphopantetheinyl transferase|nr:4'-phosphopantetheinyl transferase superfamily protein [Eubacteriales bacterium]
MNPCDIIIYICPDDGAQDSDTRICRFSRAFLAQTGQTCVSEPVIFRPVSGRPRFTEDGLPYFSVSHSGDLWACAVSGRRVGLDIQRVTCERNVPAISRRFFHPEEIAYLEQNGYNGFFSVWTAKESYVKYTGDGIDECFSGFSAVRGSRLSDNIDGLRLSHLEFDSAYAMCVCYDGSGEACIRVVKNAQTINIYT